MAGFIFGSFMDFIKGNKPTGVAFENIDNFIWSSIAVNKAG
jgi:hypothetical protein